MPETNDLTVGMMALVAQQEREAISRAPGRCWRPRRRAGYGALGNPNGAAALRRAGKGGQPLEAILAKAAEEGAKRALADVGLEGEEAALDIRDPRSLVEDIRLVRCTAVQTIVRMSATGAMLALLAGIAIKLRTFGGKP